MDSRTRTHSRPRRSSPRGFWKHGAIPVVGLIGGIGGGKSQAAALLAARGAHVIDADVVGHVLLDQRPVRDEVVSRFGSSIVKPDGTIDRRALGAIVFGDARERQALEAIVHPRMRRTFARAISRDQRRGQVAAVVLDAAVLLEAGWDALCDRVIFIDTPRGQRLDRLAAGRGWTEETLDARERAQWPLEEKRRRADVVIVNDGPLDRLEAAIDKQWTALLAPAASGGGRERPARPSS